MILNEIRLRHLWHKSYIRVLKGAKCNIDKSASIRHSRIILMPGAKLSIGPQCRLENVRIYVGFGELMLENNVILAAKDRSCITFNIDHGSLSIRHHSKVGCRHIWIRFGGKVSIGSYTNINEGGEIRADNSINIGSYNQISYGVRIWDTNTHNMLSASERRAITERYFPYFGYESRCPKTAPIYVGDDCWIGEDTTILKGSHIGNECIIGYGTLLSGQEIPDKSRVVNERRLLITEL